MQSAGLGRSTGRSGAFLASLRCWSTCDDLDRVELGPRGGDRGPCAWAGCVTPGGEHLGVPDAVLVGEDLAGLIAAGCGQHLAEPPGERAWQVSRVLPHAQS